jgi:hypothetical protein
MAGALRLLPKVALISLIGAEGSGGFVLVVAKIDITRTAVAPGYAVVD